MVATMYEREKGKVAAARQHQRGVVVVAVKQKRSTKTGTR
jgi:hypothetical protein